MHIYFELTNQCNMNCKYCYNDSGYNKKNYMDYNDLRRAIIVLKNTYNLTSITLSGGEPLLYPKFEQLVAFLHSQNIKIILITNGSLLSQLETELISLFGAVQVSIHEDFEKRVDTNSLQQLARKTELSYNAVINKETLFKIDDYERIASKTKGTISYLIQRNEGRGKNSSLLSFNDVLLINQMYPAVFSRMFQMSYSQCCYFRTDYDVYTMDPNGYISLCPSLSSGYILGNVFSDWYSKKKEVLSLLKENIALYRSSVCVKCPLHSICKGVCPGDIGNDFHIKSLYCKVKCWQMLSAITGSVRTR